MKVSIITACYNSEKTIKKTIKSILDQDYEDIEYILIDGKSSDSTVSIANHYKNSIKTIISEPDNGIYDALNKGINLATGEIIGLLHADDFYPNNCIISEVVRVFNSGDHIQLVYGDICFVNRFGKKKRHYSGKKFNFQFGIMPPHPSVFIKKECYKKFGLFDTQYHISSDYDLLFKLIVHYKIPIKYSKNIIVYMKIGGLSNKNILSSIKLNWEIYKIHKKYGSRIGFSELFRKIPIRIKEYLI